MKLIKFLTALFPDEAALAIELATAAVVAADTPPVMPGVPNGGLLSREATEGLATPRIDCSRRYINIYLFSRDAKI